MTKRQKKRVYTSLFTIVFAVSLGFCVVNPFFPLYLKNLTNQGFVIALVFSGFFFAKMVLTPLLGKWSDYRNRRIFILSGLVIHTLVAFFFVLLPQSIMLIVILRFFQGCATAMVRPIAQAFVGDISTKNHEGTSMGTFDISFYAALAVGPVIGGLIGHIAGFRGVFLILFILCLIALFIALATITGGRKQQAAARPVANDRHCGSLRDSRVLAGLYGLIFARSFGFVCLPIFLPIFIDGHFHIGCFGIGICMASGSLVTAMLLRPMGKLSDRVNRRMLVVAGGVISGLIIIVIPWTGSLWQLILLNMAVAFFSTMSLPATSAILVEEGKSFGLGYTMGWFHSIMNAGFFIGPLVGGVLMDVLGLKSIFLVAGIFGIAGSLLFALMCPRTVCS